MAVGGTVLVLAGALVMPRSAPAATWWRPHTGVSWQWQLSGRVDTSVRAHVFDVDYQVSRRVVRALHAKDRKVICYLSAGSVESWRPDADAFPASVTGQPLDDWPGERWLDIRARSVLEPIMAARMDACRRKGFDGVEPDNVDGWSNDTGFRLTAADQLAYNRMLARMAHARGLAVGLKNDVEQVRSLQPAFDFAVNEQCVQYHECTAYRPFLRAGKPVFHAEYGLTTRQFCPTSRALGLSSIRKRLALGAWRQTC
jgi:hypothetical protein